MTPEEREFLDWLIQEDQACIEMTQTEDLKTSRNSSLLHNHPVRFELSFSFLDKIVEKKIVSGFKGKSVLVEIDFTLKMEVFDLIPPNKKCDTFKVVFDYYTPRSHFIILPRHTRKPLKTYDDLDQGARFKVVNAAMSMVADYNLQKSAVLSLHFGSWLTTKDKFHAHVCVDVEEYLSIFEKKMKEIPGWPSQDYVTKQWKASKNPRHYAINVQGYPFRTYFKEEVEAVKRYRRLNPSTSSTGVPSIRCPRPFTAILVHPSEPRVGFAVEKSAKPSSGDFLFEAQEAMIKFADQNKLTNIQARAEDDGCHVCLVLDGKSHGKSILLGP